MPIATTCPHCRHPFQTPESFAGRRVKCPKCHQPVGVPAGPPGGGADTEVMTAPPPAPDRIEAIERENARLTGEVAGMAGEARRLRRVGVVVAGLLAVACVTPWLTLARPSPGQPAATPAPAPEPRPVASSEVIARRIVLVDDAGEPRAILEIDRDGNPGLRFRSGGADRAVLGLRGEGEWQGGQLAFYGTRARVGLNLSTSGDDALIFITDKAGDERISLGTHEQQATMSMRGPKSLPSFQVSVSRLGEQDVRVWDKTGRDREIDLFGGV